MTETQISESLSLKNNYWLDLNDTQLKILRNLVNISDTELDLIASQFIKNPSKIQLLDYINKIGLSPQLVKTLEPESVKKIPDKRRKYWEKYKKTVLSLRTTEHNLSILRLNPLTEFEHNPPLFFGIGGGSRALCKGLPFDVLAMVLTGEKLRRELDLSECRILFANRITYTNISKNKEFSKESIDNVLKGERDMIKFVLKKLGIEKHWNLFLQTELELTTGAAVKQDYEKLIELADNVPFIGGHHYSIEMADIWSLVNQEHGGIKLGWFIRNLDKENGGYIMDEQPFHARFVLFLAKLGITNKVSFSYAKAGARIFPGPSGALEKESPYICYQPENRLLLSPFEKPVEKLSRSGAIQKFSYYENLLSGIVLLFEELCLGKNELGRIKRIPTNSSAIDSRLISKIDYIYKFLFENELEPKKIWREAFTKNS